MQENKMTMYKRAREIVACTCKQGNFQFVESKRCHFIIT